MDTSMTRRRIRRRNSPVCKQAQRGFSLLEVVISMAVLTVGLVSLLGVFGLAMASTLTSQEDLIAKQLANEAYESVQTARNTSQLTFDDIQNVGSANCPVTGASSCGIFMGAAPPTAPTFEPIYNAGADGIFGTADDSAAGEETLKEPGPDGVYGTSDDVQIPLIGYQRAIQISPATDANGNPIATLRVVNITVQYTTAQTRLPKTYVMNSYISQFQ
jgi:prepilin-type N-terminal cleavage/methylation domain-containing protein